MYAAAQVDEFLHVDTLVKSALDQGLMISDPPIILDLSHLPPLTW